MILVWARSYQATSGHEPVAKGYTNSVQALPCARHSKEVKRVEPTAWYLAAGRVQNK